MGELLQLDSLSEDELRLFQRLEFLIDKHRGTNRLKEAYYEGEKRVETLGISVPYEVAAKLRTVAGWAGTVVDVLDERLDWQGWVQAGADDYGLKEIYRANQLDSDSGMAHLDALIFGTGFVCVGRGFEGEPDPLITVESPLYMSGIRDFRTRRLSSAMSRYWDEDANDYVSARLYMPDQTIYLAKDRPYGRWLIVHRDMHGLGRVLVAQLVNRPRASMQFGRSEISKAVRSHTDSAVRTLMAMEMNREFYSAPQRWGTNLSADQFTRADGTVVTGWEAIIGRFLAVRADEDNPDAEPKVGQFPQGQPGPYLEHLRGLAQLISAESAIPPMYLGFASDQASSADAIRAMESRLIKRAERRQTMFGRAWLEVGLLALLVRDRKVPPDYAGNVWLKWRDAATPTRSAAADEAVKLTAAQILPSDSAVTYDRIGLSPMEQQQVEADKRRARVGGLLDGLRNAAQAKAQAAPNVAQTAQNPTPMAEAA
ncbi:phage portal protein [Nocardia transvalensis]|uniref:phage portal protein n=1 Tax=Nocardia transvalensis TaxID=37333 RepID=UPI001895804D|nr:phage portal protein [Nocardia transvalensis]MBF6333435.1 phage portal protein [Nocardia transvalensis]